MKFAPLVWRNLLRRKIRTTFTILALLVAFILYGALAAIRVAFGLGVELAGADRLVMMHKVSFVIFLPESYGPRVAMTPGVDLVTHATWFGGIYQDPRNFFAQMAVEPEKYFDMYPEFVVPPDQFKTWLADRTGAIAGRATAERFGWKIGDRIPIRGTIFRAGETFEFTLDGIYDGKPGTDTTQFLFHYKFLEEKLGGRFGQVGWYIIRVHDPQQAASLAERIDAQFANSPAESKTATEKAFVQGFANQIGDIGLIVRAILAVVLFMILLIAGNTMAQSIRERTNELAVLKTLGFTDGLILTLVLVESTILAVVGGSIGLAISWAVIRMGDPTGGFLPNFYFPTRDLILGIVLILVVGLASGLLPALQGSRLRIVDALRRN